MKLYKAARDGDVLSVVELVQFGASVNYCNEQDYRRNPVHCASENNHLDIVRHLTEHNADLQAVDTREQTPLILAAIKGNVKVVKYLINHGINMDTKDKFGCTALIRASLGGRFSVVKCLVENGADITLKNYMFGANALHEATYWGHLDVVKYLVDKGSNIEERDFDGRTSLYRAATMAHMTIIKFLVEDCHAQINAPNNRNETSLHRAALYGHLEVIKYLIAKGADPYSLTYEGKTPMQVARDSDKISEDKKTKVIKYFQELTDHDVQRSIIEQQNQKSEGDSRIIGIEDPVEFYQLLVKGSFKSYDNRTYLAGPCNVGKTTLASVLIGEHIPETWESTNGLVMYFGRNGIDLKTRKMIPLPKGQIDHVYSKVLHGMPKLRTNRRESSNSDMNWNDIEEDAKSVMHPRDQNRQLDTTQGSLHGAVTELRPEIPFSEGIFYPRAILPSQIRDDILERIRSGNYLMQIAPSDLVDFGGQKSFDMTHQLFIQHNGTIVLMFNGSKSMHEPLSEHSEDNVTTFCVLHHWVNSILTYCTASENGMPKIVFVATHSDRYMGDVEERRKELIQELETHFGSYEKRNHLCYDDLVFINATNKNDPGIELLKDKLVNLAQAQSSWGQELPMAWVPLLLQLEDMRDQGANIITRKQIEEINAGNKDLALTKNQIECFLMHQHSCGKILYFNEPELREFVTIQPSALAVVLRSFVTDKRFWPTKHVRIFERLSKTGKLKRSEILDIWTDTQYVKDLPSKEHKHFVIDLLVRLDILIKPTHETDFYFVPCMVRESKPIDYFLETCKLSRCEGICLSYKLALPFLPPTLSYRLIGAVVSTWPVKELEGITHFYHNSVVICINEKNDLLILAECQSVIVYLINKHLIPKDITASIQECLTAALRKIVNFYQKAFGNLTKSYSFKYVFQIEVGAVCKNTVCLIPASEAKTKQFWVCNRNVRHETALPLCWFFDYKSVGCPEICPGFGVGDLNKRPSKKQLMRLVHNWDIGIDTFKEFSITIGMKSRDFQNIEYQYRAHKAYFVMFMTLYKWRQTGSPLFCDLLRGLLKMGLDSHILCKATRENTDLFRVIAEELRAPLQKTCDDKVLSQLSRKLGDCSLHLGVELGLKIRDIEAIWYKSVCTRHNYSMFDDIYDILKKWKQSSKIKPTIFRLMLALEYVDRKGLKFLVKHYLDKSLDDLYQRYTPQKVTYM